MKLGTLLLRNAAIGLAQLEAALRNQVLYGGRLGTNLVELGFIDLEMLTMCTGKERTEEQYRELLASAGLRLNRVVRTTQMVAVIEAVPA